MENENQWKHPLANNEEYWKYNKLCLGELLWKKTPKSTKKGENCLYKFILSESIMLIWMLRIERVYKASQEDLKEEIRA